MFTNLASKLGGTSSRTASESSKKNQKTSGASSQQGTDATTHRPTTFADRWMMSWTEEDVTFLGEDPYGDCAGNIFAQAAVESRRRTSMESSRSSMDEGERRLSENAAMNRTPRASANANAEEKARAFFGIGPI